MNQTAVPSSPSRRRWGVILLVLTLAAVAGGSAVWWMRQSRLAQVRAALPAVPATIPNATLRDLLEKARREAEATGGFLAVAEFGQLCHANGFLREAESCWRLLIREQPKEARWHYYLADLLRTVGDNLGAEQELQSVVTADPAAAPAWLQLAEMKFKTGRHAAAEQDYRRRLDLLPDDPFAELGLARIAQLQGRPDETLTRLEQVLKKHPRFSTAHNLYAELQAAAGREDLADHHRWLGREAGRFREAADPWMAELNERCHDPRRLRHLGVIAYQNGDKDRGRTYFESAIALSPEDPVSYELLGTLLLEQGAAELARDLLIRGIDQARDATAGPLHYLKLHEANRALSQTEPARQALADGLSRYPDSADLLHALGNQLKAEGRSAEAAAAYRRAIGLNPASAETDFALAILSLETGRRGDAVQALNHALSMQPTFPKALLLLARLEMDAGRVDDAGRYLLPLLKANPGAPEIRRIVARWRGQAGRSAEKTDPAAAERHYREGLKLLPDDPELNAGLGVLLLIADRVLEAVPWLEAYHRLQPANPQAALFLGQAYARAGQLAEARRVLTAGLQQAEQANQSSAAVHLREILTVLPP